MFIKMRDAGYTRDGSQYASGLFLILFSPPQGDYTPFSHHEIRACVRSVRMSQFGHWMMSRVTIGGHQISLSGAYGADGLTCTCPGVEMWEQLTSLPQELYDAWNKGGGWNSAGAEASAMQRWALANLALLRKPIKKDTKTLPTILPGN